MDNLRKQFDRTSHGGQINIKYLLNRYIYKLLFQCFVGLAIKCSIVWSCLYQRLKIINWWRTWSENVSSKDAFNGLCYLQGVNRVRSFHPKWFEICPDLRLLCPCFPTLVWGKVPVFSLPRDKSKTNILIYA